jgi:hypothetical protein
VRRPDLESIGNALERRRAGDPEEHAAHLRALHRAIGRRIVANADCPITGTEPEIHVVAGVIGELVAVEGDFVRMRMLANPPDLSREEILVPAFGVELVPDEFIGRRARGREVSRAARLIERQARRARRGERVRFRVVDQADVEAAELDGELLAAATDLLRAHNDDRLSVAAYRERCFAWLPAIEEMLEGKDELVRQRFAWEVFKSVTRSATGREATWDEWLLVLRPRSVVGVAA